MRAPRSILAGIAVSALAACGGSAAHAPDVPATVASSRRIPPCARVRPGVGATRLGTTRQGSAVALARLGAATLAYVADADADLVRTIDVSAGVERARTHLGSAPAELLVLADGRVAATLRDTNRVAILEPAADGQLALRCSVPTASEPFGLAATDDDATLLVTTAWGKTLSAFGASDLAPRFDVDLPREPRAVLVDGDRAFVAHVVGATMSVVDLASDKHAVRSIDLRVKKLGDAKIRGGCQGFALAKSIDAGEKSAAGERPVVVDAPRAPAPKGRVFAPMVTVDPGEPTMKTSGYGTASDAVAVESPMVSVVDPEAERAMTRTLAHDGRRHDGECLLPRAAASGPDDALFVACMGSDTLIEMDARGLDPARLERRRWSLPAGPTGIAVDAERALAVAWSQFEEALTVVHLDGSRSPEIVHVDRSWSTISPAMAWGRRLFHRTDDRRISSDGRACASCHPDGREDALTWSTPDGPRQTIMLAGRLDASAPFGWMGMHPDLKVHVTNTFRRLGGRGLTPTSGTFDDLEALVAYVQGMPGPRVDDPAAGSRRAELVAHGKEIFFAEQQGCATCHVGGAGTDAVTHEVGSSTGVDKKAVFDTPSLRFVGGTAPYFHDGRFATLADLLRGSDGKMGHTLALSRGDTDALVAYLESL